MSARFPLCQVKSEHPIQTHAPKRLDVGRWPLKLRPARAVRARRPSVTSGAAAPAPSHGDQWTAARAQSARLPRPVPTVHPNAVPCARALGTAIAGAEGCGGAHRMGRRCGQPRQPTPIDPPKAAPVFRAQPPKRVLQLLNPENMACEGASDHRISRTQGGPAGPGREEMGPGREEMGPGREDMGPGREDMGPGREGMGSGGGHSPTQTAYRTRPTEARLTQSAGRAPPQSNKMPRAPPPPPREGPIASCPGPAPGHLRVRQG